MDYPFLVSMPTECMCWYMFQSFDVRFAGGVSYDFDGTLTNRPPIVYHSLELCVNGWGGIV